MAAFTVDNAVQAWARSYEGLGQEEIDQRILGFAALVRGIAGVELGFPPRDRHER